MNTEILVGPAQETLKRLPDQSVQCVITSPPYWGQRTYALKEWRGGDPDCVHLGKPLRGENAKQAWERPSRTANPRQPRCMYCDAVEVKVEGGIGVEDTFEAHVDQLMEVFGEVWRVLKDDGTFWLNYGDAYTGSGKGHTNPKNPGLSKSYERGVPGRLSKQSSSRGTLDLEPGKPFRNLPPKNLMLMPARIAMAMQDVGWILRSEIIWAKPAPMPESVKDRPTSAHEKVFLFSKNTQYYYDWRAVATPLKEQSLSRYGRAYDTMYAEGFEDAKINKASETYLESVKEEKVVGANLRNVWWINTAGFRGTSSGNHFAVMPNDLVELCIKAGTRSGDTVLDPFGGAGTVGLVANRLGRDAILCEIYSQYAQVAHERIAQDDELFG